MITNGFQKELEEVLNKYSIDNLCDTPDFLLAEYLCEHINNLQKMNRSVSRWRGNTNGAKPSTSGGNIPTGSNAGTTKG